MKIHDLVIVGGQIYLDDTIKDNSYVYISNGKIKDIGNGIPNFGNVHTINATNKIILPGFIDIHVNGGGGFLSVDGTPESIEGISKAHSRFGTTSMVVSTISVPEEQFRRTIVAIKEIAQKEIGGANVLGSHLEGPFLNPKKAGAHNKKYLLSPSIEQLDKFIELSENTIRIFSLAPELDGALQVIEHATNKGIIVGLAHSEASYEDTIKAIAEGTKLCTHIFNGMPPLHHRKPGPIGAFIRERDTYTEIISDGLHVHPSVMEIVFKSKGINNVILVTDAVNPAGTNIQEFKILGVKLTVKGNSCFIDGGGLAGSALTMNNAIKTVIDKTSFDLNDAVKMATLNPAKLLGIDDRKGSIAIGKDADLVICDADLNIYYTIVNGKVVFEA